MPKVRLYRDDTFRTYLETAQQLRETWGYDDKDIEELAKAEVPQELIDRYLRAETEFKAIQSLLYDAYKKSE